MGIGDAGAALGVAPSVLRHWETMGLLRPSRSSSGHRRYSRDDLDRGRLVQRCQAVGLSLEQIGELFSGTRESRLDLAAAHRGRLVERIDEMRAALGFLDHITACVHPVIADCPECRRFVAR